MPIWTVITSLAALATIAACGHRPAPVPAAEAGRPLDCPPDSAGAKDSVPTDSGVALGSDVYRGPRYAVDSAGRVETLPPVPARTDSARGATPDSTRPPAGCPATPDSRADSSTDRADDGPQ